MNSQKEKKPIIIVALMILAMGISKVLGMFRGVLLASSYGIGEEATAFSAASRIPLSFFDIIFASAILGCFVPIYNESKTDERGKNDQGDKFASVYLNFLLILTGGISVLGMIFGKSVLEVIAPDLAPETAALALRLLRIMFPMIIFAAASYTLVGVLQSKGEFIVPAFISAVSNVCVILYFLFLDSTFGITGLATAYTISWLLQLLTLILPLKKRGFSYKLLFDFKRRDFRRALKLTPLIIIGSWLAPVSTLIGMNFAGRTGVIGAVASLEYAVNLFTVITGITTYGVCNYIFPKLSRQSGDGEEFSQTAGVGLTSSFLLMIPISMALAVLSRQVVAVVYMRDAFDAVAAEQVSGILLFLVPGMVGFTMCEVMSRVFYAMKKPSVPVISVLCGIAVNLMFQVIFVGGGSSVYLLGLAYSLGMLTAGIIMTVCGFVMIKGFYSTKYLINIIKIFLSGTASYFVMSFSEKIIRLSPYTDGIIKNILTSSVIFLIGVIVYFILLFALRENNVCGILKKGAWSGEKK